MNDQENKRCRRISGEHVLSCPSLRSVGVYACLSAVASVAWEWVQLLTVPLIVWRVETASRADVLLVTVLTLAVLSSALAWCVRYLDGLFSQSRERVRLHDSACLSQKALTASYSYTIDPAYSRRLHLVSETVNSGADAPVAHIWKTRSNLLINTVGFVTYAVLLSRLSPWLLAVATVSAVAIFAATHYVENWGCRHRAEETARHEAVRESARHAESAALAKEIRVFGLVPWLKEIRDSGMRAVKACVDRRARVYLLTNIADALLTVLRNGVAYAVLILTAFTDGLCVWEFLLYFSAIGGFTLWVRGLLSDAVMLRREAASVRAYREFLAQDEPFCFEKGAHPAKGILHTLELKNISFTYPNASEPTLRHVNLTLHAGEKLAVVGLSGSGKTTLAKLIVGLLDPDEGCVLLDGVDVRTLDRRAYYELFSTVFQEVSLLPCTVAQTVTQQTDDGDIARVWACLRTVGMDGVIAQLPEGVNTCITPQGTRLSGGQLQRLLLARALYKDGDMLILDEPTTALDPIAEHDLYQECDRITQGKSALFISHRLASTGFCDRIAYLENGTVCEEGAHEDLMRKNGRYAQLFRVQSRYYREGRESL